MSDNDKGTLSKNILGMLKFHVLIFHKSICPFGRREVSFGLMKVHKFTISRDV